MGNQLKYTLASMRPQQWIKNFFLFAPLVFAGRLFHTGDLLLTTEGFLLFSFLASGVYIFNDLADLEKDKLHPLKSQRPLPSGKLSIQSARIASIVLIAGSIATAFALSVNFGWALVMYAALNAAYSLKLKDVVILDVMTISGGFVLRVVSGALLINVSASEWLLICTLLLALFLGFSKRRHEMTILESHANEHRQVLQHYSPYFLDQMIGIVTASTVMSYALYTISEETVRKFGTNHLVYTVPFVLYGIFRYLYLVHKKIEGGNPAKLALTDRPLLATIVIWIAVVCLIIYKG